MVVGPRTLTIEQPAIHQRTALVAAARLDLFSAEPGPLISVLMPRCGCHTMGDLRRNPFRIPRDVDHVISVRPRWSGTQADTAAQFAVLRIWYDGHVDYIVDVADREVALARAKEVAAAENTVYMRAPDDVASPTSIDPKFGAVPGVHPGQRFHRRADVRQAGLHRNPQQGIDWCSEGALAVVFAGGYVDDRWSEDDPWYTGMGGQDTPGGSQVRDQELTLGNRALMRNLREGLPVRVIRKVERDGDFEYLYEGLFNVVDHTYQPGRDGPKVYRFQLRRANST
jgi:hypothetical protein